MRRCGDAKGVAREGTVAVGPEGVVMDCDSMRIRIDEDLCEGNALCQKTAPAVFTVGDDDRAHLLIEVPPDTMRAEIELAVRRCPRQALTIVED